MRRVVGGAGTDPLTRERDPFERDVTSPPRPGHAQRPHRRSEDGGAANAPVIYSPPGFKEENLESKKNKKKLREIYRNSELDRKAAASKMSSDKYKSRIDAINSYLPRGS